MDPNREFHELVGLCWHEWDYEGDPVYCIKCSVEYDPDTANPNYAADPRLVLKEMRKIGKLEEFLRTKIYPLGSTGYNIPINYFINSNRELETTGKLRDEASEFLKKVTKQDLLEDAL